MMKILIGGSPCTKWSIAQTKDRETQPQGEGWELFKNYLIAKEKFKPDLFLYENNKSAAAPIKEQICKELGQELMYINSALVSAQNRQRFYVFNWDCEQPQDRGIVLRDVLESGSCWNEKSYCLTATEYKGSSLIHNLQKHVRTQVAEPVLSDYAMKQIKKIVDNKGYFPEHFNLYNAAEITNKAPVQTTACGKLTTSATVMSVLPIRVGEINKGCQGDRIYSTTGKSVCLSANGGGAGTKTGLYAVPYITSAGLVVREATQKGYTEITPGNCVDLTMINSKTRRGRNMRDKCNCLTTSHEYCQYLGTIDSPVYEVEDGLITIKNKQYPIKLIDGYYIIRKLTPIECERLQTMPDNYTAGISNTQRYKCLGNGWTADVIIHILNAALKDVPRYEKIQVLSMYDGIATGRYCLDKMGFKNIEYHAYEIDKYAVQVAMKNYRDIIQHGDAFGVVNDW